MISRAVGSVRSDERLQSMVDAIVTGVQPARVVLFGSRARGDAQPDSDYDLLVELDVEPSGQRKAHARITQVLRGAQNGASIDVLVRRPGEIEARRDDPGYIEWEIARDGIVLYPPGTDSESLRPSINGRRVRERGRYESITSWLERTRMDFWVVQQALDSGESAAWGAAGFHAQQIAEKYLEVLFIQRGVRPPRIHKLDELIARLRDLGYDLPSFVEECELLNPYAVSIRYPEQLPLPSEAEGRDVIAAARRILDAVVPIISG